MSSIREGYGLSVLEANSFGTPAMGWNVPGLRDSIINNTIGLLGSFPHNDDLARQIYHLMTDDSVSNNMSERAVGVGEYSLMGSIRQRLRGYLRICTGEPASLWKAAESPVDLIRI